MKLRKLYLGQMGGDTVIQVERLTKTYGKQTVLSNVGFHVKEGEAFALLGSNGAGKTTTIRILLGLAKASAGTVLMKTRDIGYQQETPAFPPYLSGAEVLAYYGRLQGMKAAEAKTEAERLMKETGLAAGSVKTRHYSKGMLQRLALAQALLGDPQVLILDEPTAGLDAMGRVEMIRLLCRLKAQGKTILINSHILSDMERICDRGLILAKGRVYKNWDKEQDAGKTLEQIFLETMEAIA